MTRSKRMEPIRRIADTHERNAALQVGYDQRALAEQEARLNELIGYRDEYERKLREAGRSGVGAARLRDYRDFMERLNTVIEQQERQVATLRQKLVCTLDRWTDTRQQAKVMGNVISRYRADEQRQHERIEQRESDERALHHAASVGKPKV